MTTIFLSAKPSHHICSHSRLDTKWGKNLGSLDSFSLIHIFSRPFSQGGLPSRGTLCWQTNKQAFSSSGEEDDLQLKYDNNSHCFHNNKYCQHQSGNHVDYNNCQHNPRIIFAEQEELFALSHVDLKIVIIILSWNQICWTGGIIGIESCGL